MIIPNLSKTPTKIYSTVFSTIIPQAQNCSSNSPVSFYLDETCEWDQNHTSFATRAKQFNIIYETGHWGTAESRSGGGSSITGAFDWIQHLRSLFQQYNIQSMADIPCGDTYWQFTVKEINTIPKVYFGGDISSYVIQRNQIHYRSHSNKIFKLWDLVRCKVPTFTLKNSTHEVKGNAFELIVIRDALQHMNIHNGLKAVRNAVNSGAKFLAVSSYPPHNKGPSSGRSLGKNETLPIVSELCQNADFCKFGAIEDGGYYQNNINCPPYNFPLHKALLVQPSHKQFQHENDEIHVYAIDDDLKKIVEQYDKACPTQ